MPPATVQSPGRPAPPATSDTWYVAVAPDDIKSMTLEQLDDAYRLDVISDSTLVLPPGATEWQPLSIVAGLEEPPPLPAPAGQSVPVHSPNSAASSTGAPQQPSALHSRPPTISAPPLPPRPQTSVAPSLRPVTLPDTDIETLDSKPRFRVDRWLIAALALASAVTILHRNGLLYAAAESVSLGDRYAALEAQLLGGPERMTPRGVAAFVAAHAPETMPEAVPEPNVSKEPDVVIEDAPKAAETTTEQVKVEQVKTAEAAADSTPNSAVETDSVTAAQPAEAATTVAAPKAQTGSGPVAKPKASPARRATPPQRATTSGAGFNLRDAMKRAVEHKDPGSAASKKKSAPKSDSPWARWKAKQKSKESFDPLNSKLEK